MQHAEWIVPQQPTVALRYLTLVIAPGASSSTAHEHSTHLSIQDPSQRASELVQLPDIDNRMAPASQLHVNDASWLDAGGLRLVHPGLPDSVAEMLGVKSLRCVGAWAVCRGAGGHSKAVYHYLSLWCALAVCRGAGCHSKSWALYAVEAVRHMCIGTVSKLYELALPCAPAPMAVLQQKLGPA